MKQLVDPMILGFLLGLLVVLFAFTKIIKSKFLRTDTDNNLRILPLVTGLLSGGIAIYPATYFGIVAGGTLGGGYAEWVSMKLGHGSSGVPYGITAGIGLVFSAITFLGTAIGIVAGKAIERAKKA